MSEDLQHQEIKEEIHVCESDIKDLTLIDKSDYIFAILYGVLFVWGLVLTLVSI